MEPSMNEKGVPLMERLCRIDLRVSLQIIHLADRSWWVHQDSNLGPAGYEPVALTAELWTPGGGILSYLDVIAHTHRIPRGRIFPVAVWASVVSTPISPRTWEGCPGCGLSRHTVRKSPGWSCSSCPRLISTRTPSARVSDHPPCAFTMNPFCFPLRGSQKLGTAGMRASGMGSCGIGFNLSPVWMTSHDATMIAQERR